LGALLSHFKGGEWVFLGLEAGIGYFDQLFGQRQGALLGRPE